MSVIVPRLLEKASNLTVDLEQIVIVPLPQDLNPGDFDCGTQDYNDYLTDGTAQRDEAASVARVYIATFEGVLIGYFAILNDAIRLETKERPDGVSYPSVPALKIGRLATSVIVQGQGVGKYLVQIVVGLAREQARVVGCRFVTLDALPERESFYEKLGFKKNKLVHKDYKKIREQDMENTSMRFDIRE